MKNSLKEIVTGFGSLVTGMKITLGQFFKPSVTVQYPHESLKMATRFRGHIELVRDPETGKAICFACKLCERACPSDCITVEGAKLDGAKKKSVTEYKLDFTKCSLCGSCVEVCPTDVFDPAPGQTPLIARHDDCHSCRQCALHCPVSAIYVTLLNKPSEGLNHAALISAGKLSAYADWLGWKFERQRGDPKLLRDLLWGNWDAARFQIIEPGMQLGQSADENILRAEPPTP